MYKMKLYNDITYMVILCTHNLKMGNIPLYNKLVQRYHYSHASTVVILFMKSRVHSHGPYHGVLETVESSPDDWMGALVVISKQMLVMFPALFF